VSTRPAATRRHLPRSPFNNLPTAPHVEYAVADRVCHDRHGLGKVVKVEEERAVIVDFKGGNVRRVTLPSTKLTKL
jgi:hypothetical protein